MKSNPRGLIMEAYNIESISDEECRAIFFGWALALDENSDPLVAIKDLLGVIGNLHPTHPMTKVLREGLVKGFTEKSRRKGRRNKLKEPR